MVVWQHWTRKERAWKGLDKVSYDINAAAPSNYVFKPFFKINTAIYFLQTDKEGFAQGLTTHL